MDQYKNKSVVAAMRAPVTEPIAKGKLESRVKMLEDAMHKQNQELERIRRDLGRMRGHIDDLQRRVNNVR